MNMHMTLNKAIQHHPHTPPSPKHIASGRWHPHLPSTMHPTDDMSLPLAQNVRLLCAKQTRVVPENICRKRFSAVLLTRDARRAR